MSNIAECMLLLHLKYKETIIKMTNCRLKIKEKDKTKSCCYFVEYNQDETKIWKNCADGKKLASTKILLPIMNDQTNLIKAKIY